MVARRDFTINALSADPLTLAVHDYFGGEADLAARRLRFIGNPLTRIAEDHLRILRFFRFHARFVERGILRPVLPEIDMEGVGRLDALVASEIAAGVETAPLRRLAALLPPDVEIAAAVAARLRLSQRAAKRLISAASQEGTADAPEALAFRIGAEEATDRLLLVQAPAERVKALAAWEKPIFPLTGGDLIAMGLRPGPIVASILREIERAWIQAGFSADPEEIRKLARARVDQALRDRQ